jgi:hypothetical protein
MIKKLIFTLLIVSSWLFCANGQINKAAQSSLNNRIQNKVLGISFSEVGKVSQVDNSTYNINLSSSDNLSNPSATAQISVVNRLYVDLPGSYGGRLYLDSPAAAKLIKNKLLVDSVDNGQQIFKRQYWAVYGGMGMWDCVINCYTYANGKYYIVSLVQDKMMGKPGEIVNGKPVSSNVLKLKVLSSLRDTTNPIVNKFDNLVSSFQIQY